MDKKFSDEQIDRIAKNLLRDFAPDDETLDEIAESPRLWWNVRNGIEAQRAIREPRFFDRFRPSLLAFGALLVFACLGLTVLFVGSGDNSDPTIAGRNVVQSEIIEVVETPADSPPNAPAEKPVSANSAPTGKVSVKDPDAPAKFVAKNRHAGNSAGRNPKPSKPESANIKREETKTDFIALSYAARSDSGQLLRVKVPSSMMVSLGVKTTVERESELVSAEVLIGDDGMARAIRFIR